MKRRYAIEGWNEWLYPRYMHLFNIGWDCAGTDKAKNYYDLTLILFGFAVRFATWNEARNGTP